MRTYLVTYRSQGYALGILWAELDSVSFRYRQRARFASSRDGFRGVRE